MAVSPDRGGLDSLAEAAEPELRAVIPPPEAKKRNPAPRVRVVGRQIYDPENSKTCHQCRQKTTDFAATCKFLMKKGQCTIKYWKKCLLNRYGEKVPPVPASAASDTHPRCRRLFPPKPPVSTTVIPTSTASARCNCHSTFDRWNKQARRW